jgi:hypothetical protein
MRWLEVLHDLVRMQDEVPGQGDGRSNRKGRREDYRQESPRRLAGRLEVKPALEE